MNNRIMAKGISPLIAAVLLIAITVAIATLVTGWMSTITRSTQTSVENRTTEAVDCAAASVSIDQVYFVPNNTVRVVVRNSGQTDNIQIVNVTVINVTGSRFSFGTSEPVLSNFDRGNSYIFAIVNPVSAGQVIGRTCPGDFSKAMVTTNCGGVYATFDRTPRCG